MRCLHYCGVVHPAERVSCSHLRTNNTLGTKLAATIRHCARIHECHPGPRPLGDLRHHGGSDSGGDTSRWGDAITGVESRRCGDPVRGYIEEMTNIAKQEWYRPGTCRAVKWGDTETVECERNVARRRKLAEDGFRIGELRNGTSRTRVVNNCQLLLIGLNVPSTNRWSIPTRRIVRGQAVRIEQGECD